MRTSEGKGKEGEEGRMERVGEAGQENERGAPLKCSSGMVSTSSTLIVTAQISLLYYIGCLTDIRNRGANRNAI